MLIFTGGFADSRRSIGQSPRDFGHSRVQIRKTQTTLRTILTMTIFVMGGHASSELFASCGDYLHTRNSSPKHHASNAMTAASKAIRPTISSRPVGQPPCHGPSCQDDQSPTSQREQASLSTVERDDGSAECHRPSDRKKGRGPARHCREAAEPLPGFPRVPEVPPESCN